METVVDDLATWLNERVSERGWSLRETARRVGVSHTTIINIANGQVRASPELCQGLARVFGVPPEEVFRRAGLLPPAPDETPTIRELVHLFSQLPAEEQDDVIAIVRTLLARRREQRKQARPTGKP